MGRCYDNTTPITSPHSPNTHTPIPYHKCVDGHRPTGCGGCVEMTDLFLFFFVCVCVCFFFFFLFFSFLFILLFYFSLLQTTFSNTQNIQYNKTCTTITPFLTTTFHIHINIHMGTPLPCWTWDPTLGEHTPRGSQFKTGTMGTGRQVHCACSGPGTGGSGTPASLHCHGTAPAGLLK